MRTARALIASIGTSVMLVAAVTFSLLSISAVFALGGFEGSRDASSADAIVLDLKSRSGSSSQSGAGSEKAAAVAVVDRPPARSAARARRPARHLDPVRSRPSTASASGETSSAAALGEGTAGQPPEEQRPAAPAAPRQRAPNLGDGIRQLGDGVSASVRQTGAKLADATAPLGQPVSAAVAQVLAIVAAVMKGTTDALGAVLGSQQP